MIMNMLLSFRLPRLLLFLATSLSLLNFAQGKRVEHLGCYAEWNETTLTIGNELVERQWRIEPEGLLRPISFYDKAAASEWLRAPSRQPAPFPETLTSEEKRALEFSVAKEKLSPVEADSLIIHAIASGKDQSFYYRFQIFPESGGITATFSTDAADETESSSAADETESSDSPTGLENNPQEAKRQSKFNSALDDLQLDPAHLRYTQVELFDQTDHYDELVHESEWLARIELFDVKSNIFHIEDTLTQNGLIFLKLAPLPHARPVSNDWDVKVFSRNRRVAFGGHGYPWTIIPYQGGRAGRITAIQRYQRCLREYEPQRDGMLLSNTWGDRSRDARVTEAFLM